MRLRPLHRSELDQARALLVRALPYDRIDVVAEEKLFGSNGARDSRVVAAQLGDGRLDGVLACAGRWVKLIAVDPAVRRRGVGSALLAAARAGAPAGASLRIADHPGNYLTPGIDGRDEEALGFFTRRGFVRREEVENLRAPLLGNPLVTPERAAERTQAAAGLGYAVERVGPGHPRRDALLAWIERDFAAVWAFEAARASDGPRQALHAAFSAGQPIAFAAADGNNQGLGWFGPAGTDPAHRGRGLGEALLLRCLLDVRGLPDGGVIAWIGPKAFYARSCGAVSDRRFIQLEGPREPT